MRVMAERRVVVAGSHCGVGRKEESVRDQENLGWGELVSMDRSRLMTVYLDGLLTRRGLEIGSGTGTQDWVRELLLIYEGWFSVGCSYQYNGKYRAVKDRRHFRDVDSEVLLDRRSGVSCRECGGGDPLPIYKRSIRTL